MFLRISAFVGHKTSNACKYRMFGLPCSAGHLGVAYAQVLTVAGCNEVRGI